MSKLMTITEFARLGGKARAKKLSAKRRSEIAKKAADAATKVRVEKAAARRRAAAQKKQK